MKRLAIILFSTFLCISSFAQESRGIQAKLVDAVQKFLNGDYTSAGIELARLKRADPDNDAILYYLGMCNYAQNDLDSAAKYLRLALEADPDNVWYNNALANVLVASGKASDAVPCLEKMVSYNPGLFATPYALTMLGDGKLDEKDDSLATAYYDQALAQDPSYMPARLGKAETYRLRGDYDGFFAESESIVKDGGIPLEQRLSFVALLLERFPGEFISRYAENFASLVDCAIGQAPDNIALHYYRMNIAYAMRDSDEVIEQAGKIVEFAGDNKQFLLLGLSCLGDEYHERGEKSKAYKTYDKALKADPEYLPVLNNYAYFLSVEGKQLKKALKMSSITIEKEPENATYLDTYGWILHLLRRDAEAKDFFKQAIVHGGRDSAVILEHYITVLEALGEGDAAECRYYKGLLKQ